MSYSKLKRPPHVPNWVRYNFPNIDRTTKALVNFVKSAPQYTYSHGLRIIHDMVALGLEPAQALESARRDGRTNSRVLVEGLVQAFIDYGDHERLSGLRVYDVIHEKFKVARDLSIPVNPTATVLIGGRLRTIFVVGWKQVSLDEFQRCLMMTIIEDAVFSHTDFLDAEGEFLMYPQNSEGIRESLVWRRGDVELLNSSELMQQMEVFVNAWPVRTTCSARRDGLKGRGMEVGTVISCAPIPIS